MAKCTPYDLPDVETNFHEIIPAVRDCLLCLQQCWHTNFFSLRLIKIRDNGSVTRNTFFFAHTQEGKLVYFSFSHNQKYASPNSTSQTP